MSQTQYVQTWDLESIFPGGSQSKAFAAHLEDIQSRISDFSKDVEQTMNEVPEDIRVEAIAALVLAMQEIAIRVREAGAFVSCLNAQDVKDVDAQALTGRLASIRAANQAVLTRYDDILKRLTPTQLDQLLSLDTMSEFDFVLRERIRRSNDALSSDKEALIAALSVDGYHAWSDLYDAIVGRMTAVVDDQGKRVELSMGQLANRMLDASKEVRDQLFEQWESAWEQEATLCAQALNHIAGHRLAVYEARGWHDVLKEPLEINRMSKETLETMWAVIEENRQPFVDFLNAKAKRLGIQKLSFTDVDAPLGDVQTKYTFDEAADFIVRHFEKFDPNMAAFARRCFEQRWIEAEDRPGKRPGGFCTSFPLSKQTRIFVTFSGTPGNVATLAHELGHAYHQHVMREMPQLVTNYAMNVAETASTFAEAIVSDASVREASSEESRLVLLEDKVGRSVAMFMNIYARFLFETRFYAARRKGTLSPNQLNALMKEAQEEAFGGALANTHPHFWASKLHFYITGTPFYNFPYTFGYLFSNGIYARALEEGPSFAGKYVDLLRDTGRMRVEDLARKHLDVDLHKPEFWQASVDLAVQDARAFCEAVKRNE